MKRQIERLRDIKKILERGTNRRTEKDANKGVQTNR